MDRGAHERAAGSDGGGKEPATPGLPLERLQLSPRTLNCLRQAQITTVGEALAVPDENLLKIRNFGENSLKELKDRPSEHGFPQSGGET